MLAETAKSARTMSAGKSSPIQAPARVSACRPSWCRSNSGGQQRQMEFLRLGTVQIQLSRRKEASPTTAVSPSKKVNTSSAARWNTPWSSRSSSWSLVTRRGPEKIPTCAASSRAMRHESHHSLRSGQRGHG